MTPRNRVTPVSTPQGDLIMRKYLIALSSTLLLASAGAAFAQSQQGGYLGLNPGAHLTAAGPVVPEQGSEQGGYLGLNPGKNLIAAGPVVPAQGSGEGGYLGMIPGSTPGEHHSRG
jgi:hypothetical protein